jgi:hypothetical protein
MRNGTNTTKRDTTPQVLTDPLACVHPHCRYICRGSVTGAGAVTRAIARAGKLLGGDDKAAAEVDEWLEAVAAKDA